MELGKGLFCENYYLHNPSGLHHFWFSRTHNVLQLLEGGGGTQSLWLLLKKNVPQKRWLSASWLCSFTELQGSVSVQDTGWGQGGHSFLCIGSMYYPSLLQTLEATAFRVPSPFLRAYCSRHDSSSHHSTCPQSSFFVIHHAEAFVITLRPPWVISHNSKST